MKLYVSLGALIGLIESGSIHVTEIGDKNSRFYFEDHSRAIELYLPYYEPAVVTRVHAALEGAESEGRVRYWPSELPNVEPP